MLIAFKKYKEHRARQARNSAQDNNHGNFETQWAGVTDSNVAAGGNAVVNSPEIENKPAEATKKKKTDLSPGEIAEKKRRRAYRWKVVLGLFAPFALQSLDNTIVASALPFIATDFSASSSSSRPIGHVYCQMKFWLTAPP